MLPMSVSMPAAPPSEALAAGHAEFTLPQRFRSDRRNPVRWIVSYAVRHPFLWLMLVVGAFSNVALAAVIPVVTGQAFNAVLQQPPNTTILVRSALLILVSQLLRVVCSSPATLALRCWGSVWSGISAMSCMPACWERA